MTEIQISEALAPGSRRLPRQPVDWIGVNRWMQTAAHVTTAVVLLSVVSLWAFKESSWLLVFTALWGAHLGACCVGVFAYLGIVSRSLAAGQGCRSNSWLVGEAVVSWIAIVSLYGSWWS